MLPANRQLMRDALVARYFPNTLQIKNQQSEIINRHSDFQLAEDTPEYGRSPAFRRKILDPRRSKDEKDLIALSGQILLLPQDEAFHPGCGGTVVEV